MTFLNDRLASFHRVADPRGTYPQSLRQCPERYPRLPHSPIAQKASGLYFLLLMSPFVWGVRVTWREAYFRSSFKTPPDT